MKLRIPHLVVKPGRGGKSRHYWQPSAALRNAGWQPQNLGHDFDAAMKAAMAWNQRVTEWRSGKSTQAPAGVRGQKALLARFARPDTVRELITAFKAERWDHLGAHTRRTYQSALNVIDEWAGDQSPAFITPERCRVLLKALAKPAEPGGPERLHRAAGIGRVLRTLMGWAVDNDRLDRNPMDRVTIREPAPRHQVWPDHAVDAFVEMADAMGEAAIGTALLLAMDTGQREADLLALTWRKLPWIEGRRHIRLQQGKTGVWIEVPLTARLHDRLAKVEADNRAHATPSLNVLTMPGTNKPWPQVYFIRRFAEVRTATISGTISGTIQGEAQQALEPCTELEGLQFRDARRTLIVRLQEAGASLPDIAAISGHKIEACKKILETYMPRTRKMATAGIERLETERARLKGATAKQEQKQHNQQ